ncbi:unnamed protein product, partial [Nesidiocoris tenuis]
MNSFSSFYVCNSPGHRMLNFSPACDTNSIVPCLAMVRARNVLHPASCKQRIKLGSHVRFCLRHLRLRTVRNEIGCQ